MSIAVKGPCIFQNIRDAQNMPKKPYKASSPQGCTWPRHPVSRLTLPQQLRVELLKVVVVLAPHHMRQLVAQCLTDAQIPSETLPADIISLSVPVL